MVEGPFWNKSIETAPIEELLSLQIKLLKRQMKQAYENSRFYKKKFAAQGIQSSQIHNLDDIKKIPFTTRGELENNFEKILSIPLSEVATVRQTSGTTGNPLVVAHSKMDVDVIGEAYARKLTYHGITNKDVVQVTGAYGLWQGAWSVHWGAKKIGSLLIPIGPGDTEKQIHVLKRFGTTVLYAVTNYHFRIAEVAKQLGENLRNPPLRVGICVGEKPTKQQVRKLREEFGYETVMIDYGATEFPGFSVHCRTDPTVHHVWSDYYLIEAVNPDTHEPLQEGERGELVITSLQREAFPLIRYLTQDITDFFGFEKCDCGLTHPKIGIDIDRKDFMVKVRGTQVFPSQLEFILENFEDLTGRNQIIVDKRTPSQEVILKVEEKVDLSRMKRELLKQEIRRKVKTNIGITINDVLFIPYGIFEDKLKKSVVIK